MIPKTIWYGLIFIHLKNMVKIILTILSPSFMQSELSVGSHKNLNTHHSFFNFKERVNIRAKKNEWYNREERRRMKS